MVNITDPLTAEKKLFAVSDPTIAGAAVWLGFTFLGLFFCLLCFELIRRRPWAKVVFYTRKAASIPDALDTPAGMFGWVRMAVRTPESYLLENVGLDAVMFLRFLWMCFTVCAILSICIIPTIVPVNYFSRVPETPIISRNTSELIAVGRITMDRFSISNVPDGSHLLFFHVVSAYLVCYWLFLVLHKYYRDYAALAGVYLRENGILAQKTPAWRKGELVQLRTVMVQNIPEQLKSDEALKNWFESLGIGQVETVVIDRKATSKIEKLYAQRNRNLFKLEQSYIKWVDNIEKEIQRRGGILTRNSTARREVLGYQRNAGDVTGDAFDTEEDVIGTPDGQGIYEMDKSAFEREKTYIDLLDEETLRRVRPKLSLSSRRNVPKEDLIGLSNTDDAIDHYTEKMQIITSNLNQQRIIALKPPQPHSKEKPVYGSTGFVTFSTQRSAMIAAQSILHTSDSLFTMNVTMAPAPQDVVWEHVHTVRKYLQSAIINFITFIMCLFMVIPTSEISSIVNSAILTKVLGVEQQMANGDVIQLATFLMFCWDNLVPVFVVGLLNNGLVPYLLGYMTRYQGFKTSSEAEKALLSKYFFYIFFNVFFIFTLIWPLWTLFEALLDNPIRVIKLVSKTLPTGATFFINYIIMLMLTFPYSILRVSTLLYTQIYKAFIRTPRQFYQLNFYTSNLNYGGIYPNHILVFVIVICYSIISPLIIVPGTIYFGLGWLVSRNQLLFVFVKEYESYGRHWIMAFNRCVLGLVVFQISLAGIMASKGANIQALCLLPLLPLTYFYWRFCHLSYRMKTTLVPLDQLPSQPLHLQNNHMVSILKSSAASPNYKELPADLVRDPTKLMNDVVASPEEHFRERYPTTYMHPVLAKPLPRPWIPRILASWYASGSAKVPLYQSALTDTRVKKKTVQADQLHPDLDIALTDLDPSPQRKAPPRELPSSSQSPVQNISPNPFDKDPLRWEPSPSKESPPIHPSGDMYDHELDPFADHPQQQKERSYL